MEAADKKLSRLTKFSYLSAYYIFASIENFFAFEQCFPSIILSPVMAIQQDVCSRRVSLISSPPKTVLVLRAAEERIDYPHILFPCHYLQFNTSEDIFFTAVSVPQFHFDNCKISIPKSTIVRQWNLCKFHDVGMRT
jgi:hypothetical protein